jgi:NADH-quinone oxidoreductase subunit E
MGWKAIDRNAAPPPAEHRLLGPALVDKIRALFGRYETKRAALLPALHMIQNQHGHISWQAMAEVAELLEINASDVFDVVSFYSYFWTHPRGEKVVTVCRSISCELMGAGAVLDECRRVLGIAEHQTTSDGRYSLQSEECLAVCDHAPCMYVNEKCHKRVKPADVARILADPDNDRLTMQRSTLYDGA